MDDPAAAGDARYRASRRVTLVGAAANGVMAVGKIAAGVAAHSQALVADGIHSLSDLFTDALVLFGAHQGNRAADADHPYGHARFETAVTLALGGTLIAVAAGLAWDAISRLFQPEALFVPGPLALWAAVGSVLINEGLYQYTAVVARRVRSPMLRANAWHHRSDAVSSLVVIVGVAGTMAGLDYLDAVAAVIVGVMVGKVGWDLLRRSMRELVDTGLEDERLALIRRTIQEVDGVEDLHFLRTRRMGPDALVDVHVLVAPRISISEGHHIAERVVNHLKEEVDEVNDVLVHIDPEDDQTSAPSVHLPSRAELLPRLEAAWADTQAGPVRTGLTFHYLDGRIELELRLPRSLLADGTDAEALRNEVAVALAEPVPEVGSVRLTFE
ncbi:cation diffusion facilitator family transporter [Thiohalospira halophila DSM 15071]|uniref:Cation diffusion facilitator family transporter n=1 Tax=Thiohalospira halophila DSM 15071 TaxID=1123397 RepID=A0A1I1RD08_9GAMM|nr:cation diffusion facilitator family transporter [Thiohalospira halophila]SFD32175.1 cation diffusion facilitator family transporter [Thiohalospira halophila DSM 15071]